MFCSLGTPQQHADAVEDLLKSQYYIDDAITPIGAELLKQKYLSEGEDIPQRLANACVAFATDREHASRLAEYISKGWFMFATPLLANSGTSRGLPISCFLNYVPDSREGLAKHYTENIFLSTNGGGIGSHWSSVRSVDEPTSGGSESTGVIPFIRVADAQVLAFRQGRTRQGAYSAYLHVSHPEIEEFLSIRSSDGGVSTRKSFHTHIGVCIPDSFMEQVKADGPWDLIDPHSGRITKTLKARELWAAILKRRFADRGEPYLFFEDTANTYSGYAWGSKDYIRGSNLCTEITLATDEDNTAVCCLSSVNVSKFEEWKTDSQFIADLVEMLDNALTVFITQAPEEMFAAVYSSRQERSIGLGAMGVHAYCQQKSEPLGACSEVFDYIESAATKASVALGKVRGIPDKAKHLNCRHTHITAIAPNASSSLMLGTSPGIEPYRSNVYTIVQGPITSKFVNPQLARLIEEYFTYKNGRLDSQAISSTWDSIEDHNGSVQHLEWMSTVDKLVYRTFSEINQMEIVEAASVRQIYIDQAQSVNLCFRSDADPKHVNDVHLRAWEGVDGGHPLKSLYYCRVDVESKIESTLSQAKREDLSTADVPVVESVYPNSPDFYDPVVQAEFDDQTDWTPEDIQAITPFPEDAGQITFEVPSDLPEDDGDVCLVCQG